MADAALLAVREKLGLPAAQPPAAQLAAPQPPDDATPEQSHSRAIHSRAIVSTKKGSWSCVGADLSCVRPANSKLQTT